jgi:hypothetical protein
MVQNAEDAGAWGNSTAFIPDLHTGSTSIFSILYHFLLKTLYMI